MTQRADALSRTQPARALEQGLVDMMGHVNRSLLLEAPCSVWTGAPT